MSEDRHRKGSGGWPGAAAYTYVTREELDAAGGSYSFLNRHGVEGRDWWRFLQALCSTEGGRYSDLIRICLADGTWVDYEFELPEGYMQWSDLDDPELAVNPAAAHEPEKRQCPEPAAEPEE